MSLLIDDLSSPTLREHIGRLLGGCTFADIAVTSVRLAALDLSVDETRGLTHARILIGRLEARALSELGTRPTRAALDPLLRFLESGRVEVRSAGVGAWAPDFSVYRGTAGDACLIGPHWFREPIVNGPAFTTLLTDADAVARALDRFGALWDRSHDVLEPVITAIARGQSFDGA